MPSSSKREREAARRRYERRLARQQERRARARKRNAIIAAAVVLLAGGGAAAWALTSGGGGNATVAQAGSTPSATPSTTAAPAGCAYTKSSGGQVKDVGTPSAANLDQLKASTMTIKTDRGTITVALKTAQAPCTVNSFAYLASKKYFDGTKCHRLTTQGIFVLQCGDPSATGSGGPGYQFPDENLAAFGKPDASGQVVYPKGTVAMANAGPGTNGSQFFIVYKDSPLAPNYTPFGTVTAGMDIVQKVADAGTASDGTAPKLPVTIQQLTVS